MYAIYGNIYHQYTQMLAYIPDMDPMGSILVYEWLLEVRRTNVHITGIFFAPQPVLIRGMILQAPAYGNWDSLSSLSSLGSLSWDSSSILGADDAGGPSRIKIKTHMAADENPCNPQWWTSEIAGQCGFIQVEKPWCKRFWAIPAPKSPRKTETN